MKRTTVKIPDELDARLRHEATRSGKTISEVTREALEGHLGEGPPGAGVRRPHLETLIGSIDSGKTDLSRRVDEVVLQEIEKSRSS